jgi:hypothetical protein
MLALARWGAAPAACPDSSSRFRTAVSVWMPPLAKTVQLRITLAFADSVHADTMHGIGYSRIACGYFTLLVFSIDLRLRELFVNARNAGTRPSCAAPAGCSDSSSRFHTAVSGWMSAKTEQLRDRAGCSRIPCILTRCTESDIRELRVDILHCSFSE